ncbi:hypothetical protein O181_078800 [Austropuccinia psidii MF-1]|uniref:Uncharacterized protein n=1 Tax=Austropuccinia psidii MF-1 TaxID=1389203 RepID=A0A9Q3FDI5_9BASI|nr:hypothetical protein [Austropuccinia psidii MF-1]
MRPNAPKGAPRLAHLTQISAINLKGHRNLKWPYRAMNFNIQVMALVFVLRSSPIKVGGTITTMGNNPQMVFMEIPARSWFLANCPYYHFISDCPIVVFNGLFGPNPPFLANSPPHQTPGQSL